MIEENTNVAAPTQPVAMLCLLCGSYDVDAEGWKNSKGDSGPQCVSCGATGESIAIWNNRDWLIDRLTNAIDDAIRNGRCSTYDEWQSLVESLLTAKQGCGMTEPEDDDNTLTDADDEPVGSCEECGENLYEDDGSFLCDYCSWLSQGEEG